VACIIKEKDEAVALAKSVGVQEPYTAGVFRANDWELLKFAKLVASMERERCAKLIEQDLYPLSRTDYQIQYNNGIKAMANKIREMV
jgi:hypothetical protein